MARIRSIKPELPSKKKLAQVSISARYTLVLLITQADDEGFVLAEPRQLQGALYPHDEDVTPAQLEGWIRELVGINSIVVRQTVDGARVLQIIGWQEHQAVKNPGKPKISPTLLPLNGDSTESGRRVSVAEVRRFGGSEGGESDTRQSELAAASPVAVYERFASDEHSAAYLAYRKSHSMPDGLDAALRSCHAPITGGTGYDWAIIGQALVEMRGASVPFSARALRRFCEDLTRRDEADESPAQASVRRALAAGGAR